MVISEWYWEIKSTKCWFRFMSEHSSEWFRTSKFEVVCNRFNLVLCTLNRWCHKCLYVIRISAVLPFQFHIRQSDEDTARKTSLYGKCKHDDSREDSASEHSGSSTLVPHQ